MTVFEIPRECPRATRDDLKGGKDSKRLALMFLNGVSNPLLLRVRAACFLNVYKSISPDQHFE